MDIRTYPGRGHRGFTLIELLVVMSFIAILASIAIPRFPTIRAMALDAAVKSDLQNAMKAEESWFVENNAYVDFKVVDGGTTSTPDFSASKGVTIEATTLDQGVKIVGSHESSTSAWCLSTTSGRVMAGSDC